MNAIIRILAFNKPGVIDRIAGIVRRRGWNIDSLTAGNISAENAPDGLMQINLSIEGQHIDTEEFGDRLSELHDVQGWEECSQRDHFIREILLFSFRKDGGQSKAVSGISGIKIIEEKNGLVYAEYTGSPEEAAAVYRLLKENSIYCVRIGKLVLAREGDHFADGKSFISDIGYQPRVYVDESRAV